MQLVSSHIYSFGTFLLGTDRKRVCHGVFCWSAEQIAAIAHDWRLPPKDETRLTKIFMAHDIAVQSDQEPQLIHGVGAALINHQFETLQNMREVTDPRRTVPLSQGHIYFRAQSREHREQDAALLFYITPDGLATLAHVRTQDQAAELLRWEDWMEDDDNRILVEKTIETLPEFDRFNQQSTIIHGDLIRELITAQVIYRSFFPDDPTARN